jgi:hypothetical protein
MTRSDFGRHALLRGFGLAALWTVLAACSAPRDKDQIAPPATDADVVDADVDLGSAFPDSGIGTQALTLARVVPSSGSFVGGYRAVLRGSGFAASDSVFFGDAQAEPADTELIDGNRLSVVVPGGPAGLVDVRVVKANGTTVSLSGGFAYEAIFVEPSSGPITGGTRVEIVSAPGVELDPEAEVLFGRSVCRDVVALGPYRLSCISPSLAAGSVDVSAQSLDGSVIVAADGFTYFDSTDPFGGGLGGGELSGNLTVTVLDWNTEEPVPGACVVVGDPSVSPFGGTTNAAGQISFSSSELSGPQNITIAKWCYEKTTFVSANASQVTVFLQAWQDLRCAPPGALPPGGGTGRLGSFVEGELVWRGPIEYGPNLWDNIPTPRANEVRVSYVYATKRGFDDFQANPDQGGDTIQRVTEEVQGQRGYPYKIYASPGGFAVYALAGLENMTTGEFVPYVLGVGRNVLVGPGATMSNVDIVMEHLLDRVIDVDVRPGVVRHARGPERLQVRGAIDLGGEGIIFPVVGARSYNVATALSNARPLRLVGQPALTGGLADARLLLDAVWGTGTDFVDPRTTVVKSGIFEVSGGVVMDGFVGIPNFTSPAYGEAIPADRTLRWEADGAPATFQFITMTGGDGNPAWRWYLPGDAREAPIYDTSDSATCAVDDVASGFLPGAIYSAVAPGFSYENFSYRSVNTRYWTAYASDRVMSRR